MQRIIQNIVAVLPLLVLLGLGCGGAGGEHGDGGGGNFGGSQATDDQCFGFDCGSISTTVTVDVTQAKAVFAANDAGGGIASGSLSKGLAKATTSTSSPLYAVIAGGTVTSILEALGPNDEENYGNLPRLTIAAVSPTKYLYLGFERPFIYTDTATVESSVNASAQGAKGTISIADYKDSGSPSSPFTCQIFVVKDKIGEGTTATKDNLHCIRNDLELNTWDFRSKHFQFDSTGNLYFSAHIPGGGKDVLLKYEPDFDTTTSVSPESKIAFGVAGAKATSEKVNANICYRDWLVTQGAAMVYTGVNGLDCNGDGFLRFIAANGDLSEVTRGWWDFVFEPIETGTNEGQLIFYGPDPTISTAMQWDDACLYRFDPEGTPGSQSTKIANCQWDVHQFINDGADEATKRSNCNNALTMLGGHNQPDRIISADLFNGEGTYGQTDGVTDTFVIGQIAQKGVGTWQCNIRIPANVAGPCLDSSNKVVDAIDTTACTAVSGSWQTATSYDRHYSDTADKGAICVNSSVPTAVADTDTAAGWNQSGDGWCQNQKSNWMETYNGVARVHADATVELLSGTTEVVSAGWLVDNRLVYSAFDTASGGYKLYEITSTAGTNTELYSGVEFYEVIAHPTATVDNVENGTKQWFVNGLLFTGQTLTNTDGESVAVSGNSYVVGDFDPTNKTLKASSSITGQIETIVIVPDDI